MEFRTQLVPGVGPHVYLDRRAWDDHGYETTFDVYLTEPDRAPSHHRGLGTVKILQDGERVTVLPPAFTTLPEQYCSLPQSPNYDANAARSHLDVHRALRDVRFLPPDERARQAAQPGFELSLLRFSSARYMYEKAMASLSRTMQIRIRARIEGFAADHELEIDLDPDRLLGRLAVLVGENGTGKTRLLDMIARAMSGLGHPKIADQSRPAVSRVLAVSCSAFDEFMIPRHPIYGNYAYLGLRTLTGPANTIDLKDITRVAWAYKRLIERDQWGDLWERVMRELGLGQLTALSPDELRGVVSRLGAGFKYACYAFTRLIDQIELRSFVLFDEPEVHTHPRLLSAMMRALDLVLEATDSFALVATHSPIVVQEFPTRQVYRIRNVDGMVPNIGSIPDETFGAPLGEILRKAFGISHDERNFDLTLRQLVAKYGAERVREQLGDQLALPAWSLLDGLGDQRGEP